MKLEDQVCSLELAKRLKELGVEQKSYFWWANVKNRVAGESPWHIVDSESLGIAPEIMSRLYHGQGISAFTVAELGEMIKDTTEEIDCGDCCYDKTFGNAKPTMEWGGDWHEETADTEADSRAKMLIYLTEKFLVKP